MRTIMLVLMLICMALPFRSASGQNRLEIPWNTSLTVDYLERLKIPDPSRKLDQAEKHELTRLFVKVYVISKRRDGQDYLLNPQSPVYELLKTNFPSVVEREGEGGIFLGEIVRFFNKSLEFRTDVERLLKEGPLLRKECGVGRATK